MRKTKKLTKAQAEALASYEQMMKRWDSVPKFARTARPPNIASTLSKPALRTTDARPPSLMTPGGSTAKHEPAKYTGTKVLGIATMHKSNAVPIFNSDAAVEVTKMRR